MYIPLAARIVFVLVSVSASPWWLSFAPTADCTEAAEVVCSGDCSQVMVCLGVGNGGLLPVPVATCDVQSNMKCSAVNKSCIPADQSDCQQTDDNEDDVDGDFRCHNSGWFPDPYDCQKFHLCLEGEINSTLESCDGTSAYDPLSRECSLTTSDHVCTEGPIKPCSLLGQMGVVQENPRIYYICMQNGSEIVPEMYLCPDRMIFDLTVASCVEASPTTDLPRVTMGPDDTAAVSTSTSGYSYGRNREERRRWRSHHGRHHWRNHRRHRWMDISTVPTPDLAWVKMNEAETKTVRSWAMRTPRLSYRRRYPGRARWWSVRGRQRWLNYTTNPTTVLPDVTIGGAHSAIIPRVTLGRADTSKVVQYLTLGGVDITTAPGVPPGKVDTTAVPLKATSDGVDTSKVLPWVGLGEAEGTMVSPWTMLGEAETTIVSPGGTLDCVDNTMVRNETPGEVDSTEFPTRVTVD